MWSYVQIVFHTFEFLNTYYWYFCTRINSCIVLYRTRHSFQEDSNKGAFRNHIASNKMCQFDSFTVKRLIHAQVNQALVVRSYYFFTKKSLWEGSARETRCWDIVTAVIYCYITTEFTRNVTLAFQHMEVLCYIGLNLHRFVWGKTLIGVLAEILIFLRKKWLTSMLCYLFYCHPAFQRDTKPFKRIIAFWVSSPKKE